jgi:thiol-disulfide isomerase/thioredoxin
MRVLFFKASWCSACHAIEQYVPEWCEHVDCDKDPVTPLKYHVMTLPVFIAVDDCNDEIARCQTTNISALTHWKESLDG